METYPNGFAEYWRSEVKPILGSCVSLENKGNIPTDCLKKLYWSVESDLRAKRDVDAINILAAFEILQNVDKSDYHQLSRLQDKLDTALGFFYTEKIDSVNSIRF